MYELLDQLSNIADRIKNLENNREKLGQLKAAQGWDCQSLESISR